MDDPWADPWNETSKKPTTKQDKPLEPTWAPLATSELPKIPEPAIEGPTWVSRESVSWTAPSVSPPVPSLPAWGMEEPSWASTHSQEGVAVEEVSAGNAVEDESLNAEPGKREDVDYQLPYDISVSSDPIVPSNTLPSHVAPPLEIAPISFNASPSINTPRDLDDGFGGFESGLDSATDGEGGWDPSPDPYLGSEPVGAVGGDVWGSSWGDHASASLEAGQEQPDEWEAARKQKEEQDKHVPPEYLNAIIDQFEQLSAELWKDDAEPESQGDAVAHRGFDPQALDPKSCALRIVPDQLTLPLPVPFSQTFASKRHLETLKLTRHSLLTRKGPMAMYMASKGSTSWEASVKAKVDSQSDMAPAGWKIVSRSESPVPEQIQKRTSTGGGILSFFSRRSTNTSLTESPTRPASPAKSITSSIRAETSSPRPSVDAIGASTSVQGKVSNPASPLASVFSPTAPTQSPAAQTPSPAPSKQGLDFFQPQEPQEEAPQPSTVSRFFSRFSRKPSTHGESVALSADDLEFLSDVIPVTHEDSKEDDQLKALSSMIKSSPMPTKLPPPLAPPPSAPPLYPSISGRSNSSMTPGPVEVDPFSLFDTPALSDKPGALSKSRDKQQQPLPSIPYSNTAHNLGGAFSRTSSTSETPSLDIFAMAPSSVLPPPPIPPKATGTFTVPIGSRNIKPSTSRSSTPSSGQSSSIPALLPPPPPPSTQSRVGSSLQTSRAGSLPSSRSQTPSLIAPPSHPTIDEDDEFADFITSPTPAKPSQPSALSSMSTIPTAPPHQVMQFDDFNDFLNPPPPTTRAPIRDNAPPLSHSRSSSTTSTSPGNKSTGSSPRVSRAEHQRTLSLLEVAASRNQKWLSPPSPLPEALPPPDAPSKHGTDLLGGSMSTQQEVAMSSLAPPPIARPSSSFPLPKETKPSLPAWSFPAPPPASAPQKVPQTFGALGPAPVSNTPPPAIQRPGGVPTPPGWSFPAPPRPVGNGGSPSLLPPPIPSSSNGFGNSLGAVVPQRAAPSLTPSPLPTSNAKPGGLSAQDLAFFEGL